MKVIPYLIAVSALCFSSSAYAITMGDFKQTDCALPVFANNGCAVSSNTQCFEGGALKAGEKITGLSDSWTNTASGDVVMYKDEITYPSIVNVGGANSAWLSNPTKETDFWKIGSELIFTPETATKKDVFTLKAGKKVTVLEASLGANYQLERTDKKNGDYVGLVKFPVNYHVVDDTTGKAGALVNHLECAVFKVNVATAAAVAPIVKPTPPTTTPAPTGATKVKTGAADTFLFMGLAMLLALAFMFARKRKSV